METRNELGMGDVGKALAGKGASGMFSWMSSISTTFYE